MIFDIAFKLGRKALSPKLYAALSNSPLGRTRQWAVAETYSGIFRYYAGHLGDLEGKVVVEVGSGNQTFTAQHFLVAGAARVLLVEPKLTDIAARLPGEMEIFTSRNGSGPGLDRACGDIQAFGDLSAIGPQYEGRIDRICSHLVLEHVSDLEGLFRHTARLLSPSGLAHHRVDLSDHTYHVFGKFPVLRGMAARRSLYHLRYSDRVFALLNDSKCYMNRRLLPEFVKAAESQGLRAEFRVVRKAADCKVHGDLQSRSPGAGPDLLWAQEFVLELKKYIQNP